MKRLGNVYSKIYSLENLYAAHQNARKDKQFYRAVKKIDKNPKPYMKKIQKMLKEHTYHISMEDYTVSVINDKGKERELWKLPYYPHRIIQWAILLQIEHVFNKVFTDFTCASLKDRGIHYALKKTKKSIKDEENSMYCLKIDIRHFYQNIDHDILKQLLRKKFKDPELLWLLDLIIDSHGDVGVPIGSYLSQYLANFYLAYFDHWLKEELKCKYVIRYMDDMVIFNSSKEVLHEQLAKMKEYLHDELKLEIKSNWQVFPTNVRGVDFVGYRTFNDFILLRRGTCQRYKRKMLDMYKRKEFLTFSDYCTFNSYAGWLKWCNSRRLYEKYSKPLLPYIKKYYRENIKKTKKKRKELK